MHSSAMPYLTQRRQGRASSHFLQAFWQLVQAFLTWRRLERGAWAGMRPGAKGYMCMCPTGWTVICGWRSEEWVSGRSSPSGEWRRSAEDMERRGKTASSLSARRVETETSSQRRPPQPKQAQTRLPSPLRQRRRLLSRMSDTASLAYYFGADSPVDRHGLVGVGELATPRNDPPDSPWTIEAVDGDPDQVRSPSSIRPSSSFPPAHAPHPPPPALHRRRERRRGNPLPPKTTSLWFFAPLRRSPLPRGAVLPPRAPASQRTPGQRLVLRLHPPAQTTKAHLRRVRRRPRPVQGPPPQTSQLRLNVHEKGPPQGKLGSQDSPPSRPHPSALHQFIARSSSLSPTISSACRQCRHHHHPSPPSILLIHSPRIQRCPLPPPRHPGGLVQ